MMRLLRSFVLLAAIVIVPEDSRAFEVDTHEAMSEVAARKSVVLDAILSAHSSEFPLKIDHVFPFGLRVWELFRQGGADEDYPFDRVLHHFHDPTIANWLDAGLVVFGAPVGWSSIVWQQPFQALGNSYNWSAARQAFFEGLSQATRAERDSGWADTFLTLGHLVHLVQDAAAPAHTRNDPHLYWDSDGFHHWAQFDEALQGVHTAVPALPDSGLLTLAPHSTAPLPIARLIDATDEARPTPELGLTTGVAEYSNAWFFSDDRLFSAYPHPAEASLESCPGSCTSPETCHKYLCFKAGAGDTDYKVAHVSALADYASPGSPPLSPPLDNEVFRDYGKKLFPRAIGYSAALIDYFFRTSVNADGSPVLRLTATALGSGSGTLTVRNSSTENMSGGKLEIFYDDRTSGERVSAGSVSVNSPIPAGGSVAIGESVGIDFAGLLANGAVNGSVVVIYRGAMGLEADAVAERTCYCPSSPAVDPADTDGDCQGLCACRYLEFVQGNPGVPGDGLTVTGDGSNSAYASSVRLGPPLFNVGSVPEGLTMTVFPTAGVTLGAISVSYAATDSSCYPGSCTGNANASGFFTEGMTTVNGATGYFASFPKSSLRCCSRPMDDLSYVGACSNSMCIGNVSTFDAVMYCPGMSAFPQ